MKNKLDFLVIAPEYSGAREVFDLLNENLKSRLTPNISENLAILNPESAGTTGQKHLGVLELSNLEELDDYRIFHLLKPDGQIRLLLRDPIQRAYAAYREKKQDGLEHSSFIEAIKWDNAPAEVGLGTANTNYVIAGKYSSPIKSLIKNSSEYKPQFIRYETLKNSSFQLLMEIKESLQLKLKSPTEEIAHKLHKQKVAGRRSGILSYFLGSNDNLEAETAKYIYYTYYKRDIEELESLLGVNLATWKYRGRAIQAVQI